MDSTGKYPVTPEWSKWLRERMAESGMPMIRLGVLGHSATISELMRWLNGEGMVGPDSVMALALILGVDPVPPLRLAGHDTIAALTPEVMRRSAWVLDQDAPSDLVRLSAHLKEIAKHSRDLAEVIDLEVDFAQSPDEGEEPS